MRNQRYFVSYQSIARQTGETVYDVSKQTCFLAEEGLNQQEIWLKAESHLVKIFGSKHRFTINFVGPLYGQCFG